MLGNPNAVPIRAKANSLANYSAFSAPSGGNQKGQGKRDSYETSHSNDAAQYEEPMAAAARSGPPAKNANANGNAAASSNSELA